ncbi:hypothetical protein J6590_036565 [Homalodisca vitripennis]|nr:hypothetical protein J6590_036565 [Homalodisca vitripennis]
MVSSSPNPTFTAMFQFLNSVITLFNDKPASIGGVLISARRSIALYRKSWLANLSVTVCVTPPKLGLTHTYAEGTKLCNSASDKNMYQSDTSVPSHGVPQGSIIEPILFEIFLNDPLHIKQGHIVMYTDDCPLQVSQSSYSSVIQYA